MTLKRKLLTAATVLWCCLAIGASDLYAEPSKNAFPATKCAAGYADYLQSLEPFLKAPDSVVLQNLLNWLTQNLEPLMIEQFPIDFDCNGVFYS